MPSRTELGAAGEAFAAEWLAERGYRILNRNVRYRGGEIDIIAIDGDELVFVEVKLRSGSRFGRAAETVDARKLAFLLRAAGRYRQAHPDIEDMIWRIDLIAITRRGNGSIESVEHHQNLTLD
ncbi:MAG: YraN family protein [Thermomicrobiales bacterium]|nr:YraN family protein [Thermomicrobiales bacterium]